MILSFTNLLQCWRTRKLPSNLKETRVMGMSSIIALIIQGSTIWFYSLSTSFRQKKIMIVYTILIQVLMNFIFLYGPKLYIILLAPKKNTKTYFNLVMKLKRAKELLYSSK